MIVYSYTNERSICDTTARGGWLKIPLNDSLRYQLRKNESGRSHFYSSYINTFRGTQIAPIELVNHTLIYWLYSVYRCHFLIQVSSSDVTSKHTSDNDVLRANTRTSGAHLKTTGFDDVLMKFSHLKRACYNFKQKIN